MPRQQPESSSDHTYRGASQKSANPLPLWNRPRQVFLRGWVGGGSPATAAGSKIRSFQSAENGAAGSGVPAPAGSLAGVAIGVGAAAAAPVGLGRWASRCRAAGVLGSTRRQIGTQRPRSNRDLHLRPKHVLSLLN